MKSDSDIILAELRSVFTAEAIVHLHTLRSGLLTLEESPCVESCAAIPEVVCRAAHSLKGAASAVELYDVELACKALEDNLTSVKRGEIELTPSAFDDIRCSLAIVEALVSSASAAVHCQASRLNSPLRHTSGDEHEAAVAARMELRRKTILIAEDSYTSKMFLKNMLQAAGYSVRTAVNGLAAMMSLRTAPVDLVISDVEMPGMDGFELTSTIRNNEQLARLPVVLVTSRGAPEDRKRGMDAGADAYVTKGGLDQVHLLSIIDRLLRDEPAALPEAGCLA